MVYKIYCHSKKEFDNARFGSYQDAEKYLNDNIYYFSSKETKVSIVKIEGVFTIKSVPHLEHVEK